MPVRPLPAPMMEDEQAILVVMEACLMWPTAAELSRAMIQSLMQSFTDTGLNFPEAMLALRTCRQNDLPFMPTPYQLRSASPYVHTNGDPTWGRWVATTTNPVDRPSVVDVEEGRFVFDKDAQIFPLPTGHWEDPEETRSWASFSQIESRRYVLQDQDLFHEIKRIYWAICGWTYQKPTPEING